LVFLLNSCIKNTLQKLNLSYQKINIEKLFQTKWPCLRKLILTSMRIQPDVIITLSKKISNFPKLEELDFTGCTEMEEDGMIALLEVEFANLKKLNLSCCNVTDGVIYCFGFEEECNWIRKLEYLDLSNNREITDEGLLEVLEEENNFSNLRHLDLRDCRKITIKGIKKLQSLMPRTVIYNDFEDELETKCSKEDAEERTQYVKEKCEKTFDIRMWNKKSIAVQKLFLN